MKFSPKVSRLIETRDKPNSNTETSRDLMRDGSETLYEASDRRCAEESGKKSLGSRGNFAAEINYSVTVKLQNRDLSC